MCGSGNCADGFDGTIEVPNLNMLEKGFENDCMQERITNLVSLVVSHQSTRLDARTMGELVQTAIRISLARKIVNMDIVGQGLSIMDAYEEGKGDVELKIVPVSVRLAEPLHCRYLKKSGGKIIIGMLSDEVFTVRKLTEEERIKKKNARKILQQRKRANEKRRKRRRR